MLDVVGIHGALYQSGVGHYRAVQHQDLHVIAPLSHHVGDVVGEIHETGGDTENDAGLVGISGAGLLTGLVAVLGIVLRGVVSSVLLFLIGGVGVIACLIAGILIAAAAGQQTNQQGERQQHAKNFFHLFLLLILVQCVLLDGTKAENLPETGKAQVPILQHVTICDKIS